MLIYLTLPNISSLETVIQVPNTGLYEWQHHQVTADLKPFRITSLAELVQMLSY